MMHANGRGRLTACLVLSFIGIAPAAFGQSQDAPPEVFLDWTRWNNTGWMALNEGKLERAAQAFRLAINRVRPYESSERRLLARSYADYAKVLYQQKRFEDAEPLARWALKVRESSAGIEQGALCQNLDILARIQHARKNNVEAEPLLKRELELQEKGLGGGHSELIATIEALAEVYGDQGKVAEAEPLYRRAFELREATSEENLKEAERLERTVAMMQRSNAGGSIRAMSARAAQLSQLRAQANALKEASVESLSAAVSTEGYAALLRRSGRGDEADTLEARGKAIRDAVETRTARARAGR
jgi:tetratricopeptide (TPR) repeat protein